MKKLLALVTLAAILGVSGWGLADSGPQGAESLASYGRGGKNNGIEGTISAIAGSNFQMTGMKDNKVFVVKCDNNTKFMSGGKATSPSAIKVGVHVGVMGGQNGQEILANTVNILADKRGK